MKCVSFSAEQVPWTCGKVKQVCRDSRRSDGMVYIRSRVAAPAQDGMTDLGQVRRDVSVAICIALSLG